MLVKNLHQLELRGTLRHVWHGTEVSVRTSGAAGSGLGFGERLAVDVGTPELGANAKPTGDHRTTGLPHGAQRKEVCVALHR